MQKAHSKTVENIFRGRWFLFNYRNKLKLHIRIIVGCKYVKNILTDVKYFTRGKKRIKKFEKLWMNIHAGRQ